jgi:hypothetical protein
MISIGKPARSPFAAKAGGEFRCHYQPMYRFSVNMTVDELV